MKAIVCTKFGPPEVLQIKEIEKPIPGDNEVLIKVRASSVNFNILVYITGKPLMARFMGIGLLKPKVKIPGGDIAGRVEAVGRNVKQFKPGDEVFGDLEPCGYGAFAEYVCAPQTVLALKPANISFEQAAAAVHAAIVALQGLRQGQIRAGQKVLIYGASGAVGTFAVQIAKSFGAEVTGVCSTGNLELLRSLGADHVIDYTKEDFTKNSERYDLILAIAGYHSIFDYRRALTHQGIYVMVGGSMKGPHAMAQVLEAQFLGPWLSMTGSKKLGSLFAKPSQKDLIFIKGLIEAGKVKPVVEKNYPLSEVAQALLAYQERHTRGKIVITM